MQNTHAIFTQRNTLVRKKPGDVIDERNVKADKKNVTDVLVVFEHEIDIESANPDLEQLKKLNSRGVIITAKSTSYDFVARTFFPKLGIPEDPVTGSAYTQLAPFWASRLGSKRFSVKQMSSRGGELTCELVDDRVLISGKAIRYLEGKIKI